MSGSQGVRPDFEIASTVSRTVARVLILLLIFLVPWSWGLEAAAQQKNRADQRAQVEEPAGIVESAVESPSPEKVIAMRPPVWGEDFVPTLIALRQPGTMPVSEPRPPASKPQDSTTAKKSSSFKWILIAAAGGGAVAAFALKGGGGGGGSSSTSSGSISAGPPVVGPPITSP